MYHLLRASTPMTLLWFSSVSGLYCALLITDAGFGSEFAASAEIMDTPRVKRHCSPSPRRFNCYHCRTRGRETCEASEVLYALYGIASPEACREYQQRYECHAFGSIGCWTDQRTFPFYSLCRAWLEMRTWLETRTWLEMRTYAPSLLVY